MKRLIAAMTAAALLTVGLVSSTALAGPGPMPKAVYNAIPSKVTGNVPSLGFEATQTTEFGDQVILEGTARTLQSMSVVFSSWGCESGAWNTADCVTTPGATFPVPLTFTIYEDNAGFAGDVLATRTETVNVKYRPSTSANCTDGKWYNSKDQTCYNGLAQTFKMTFPGLATLTNQVIWTVAYNTTHYGPVPIGQAAPCYTETGGCGYDSFNVGVESVPGAPFAGIDIAEGSAFRNGVMESDWDGYRPLGAIVAK